eukprot:ANDGO_05323.mRNA.1 Nucleoporin NSP1
MKKFVLRDSKSEVPEPRWKAVKHKSLAECRTAPVACPRIRGTQVMGVLQSRSVLLTCSSQGIDVFSTAKSSAFNQPSVLEKLASMGCTDSNRLESFIISPSESRILLFCEHSVAVFSVDTLVLGGGLVPEYQFDVAASRITTATWSSDDVFFVVSNEDGVLRGTASGKTYTVMQLPQIENSEKIVGISGLDGRLVAVSSSNRLFMLNSSGEMIDSASLSFEAEPSFVFHVYFVTRSLVLLSLAWAFDDDDELEYAPQLASFDLHPDGTFSVDGNMLFDIYDFVEGFDKVDGARVVRPFVPVISFLPPFGFIFVGLPNLSRMSYMRVADGTIKRIIGKEDDEEIGFFADDVADPLKSCCLDLTSQFEFPPMQDEDASRPPQPFFLALCASGTIRSWAVICKFSQEEQEEWLNMSLILRKMAPTLHWSPGMLCTSTVGSSILKLSSGSASLDALDHSPSASSDALLNTISSRIATLEPLQSESEEAKKTAGNYQNLSRAALPAVPAVEQSPASVSFGQQQQEPALSFGTTAEQKPALSFGTTAEQKPALSFGTTAEQKPFGSFGTTAEQKPALSFGTTAEQKPALSFGTTAEQKPFGSFGTTAEQKPALSFGTTAEQKPALSFGTTAEQKPFGSFGTTAEQKPFGSFGTTAEQKPALSFGTTAEQKPALSLGTTAEQKPLPSFAASTSSSRKTEKPSSQSVSAPQHVKISPGFEACKTAAAEFGRAFGSTPRDLENIVDAFISNGLQLIHDTRVKCEAELREHQLSYANVSGENMGPLRASSVEDLEGRLQELEDLLRKREAPRVSSLRIRASSFSSAEHAFVDDSLRLTERVSCLRTLINEIFVELELCCPANDALSLQRKEDKIARLYRIAQDRFSSSRNMLDYVKELKIRVDKLWQARQKAASIRGKTRYGLPDLSLLNLHASSPSRATFSPGQISKVDRIAATVGRAAGADLPPARTRWRRLDSVQQIVQSSPSIVIAKVSQQMMPLQPTGSSKQANVSSSIVTGGKMEDTNSDSHSASQKRQQTSLSLRSASTAGAGPIGPQKQSVEGSNMLGTKSPAPQFLKSTATDTQPQQTNAIAESSKIPTTLTTNSVFSFPSKPDASGGAIATETTSSGTGSKIASEFTQGKKDHFSAPSVVNSSQISGETLLPKNPSADSSVFSAFTFPQPAAFGQPEKKPALELSGAKKDAPASLSFAQPAAFGQPEKKPALELSGAKKDAPASLSFAQPAAFGQPEKKPALELSGAKKDAPASLSFAQPAAFGQPEKKPALELSGAKKDSVASNHADTQATGLSAPGFALGLSLHTDLQPLASGQGLGAGNAFAQTSSFGFGAPSLPPKQVESPFQNSSGQNVLQPSSFSAFGQGSSLSSVSNSGFGSGAAAFGAPPAVPSGASSATGSSSLSGFAAGPQPSAFGSSGFGGPAKIGRSSNPFGPVSSAPTNNTTSTAVAAGAGFASFAANPGFSGSGNAFLQASGNSSIPASGSQSGTFGQQSNAFGQQPSAFGQQPSGFGQQPSQPSSFGTGFSAFGTQGGFGSQQPSGSGGFGR